MHKPKGQSLTRYDEAMRKWPIWILLVLLPLRLWAGSLMPMALPHPSDVTLQTAIAAPHEAHHACHRQASDLTHQQVHEQAHLGANEQAHEQPHEHVHHQASELAHHGGMSTEADACHEGPGCMTCSVCHLSAGLPISTEGRLSSSVQNVTASPLAPWLGHAWPPLTKPPIS